MDCRFSVEAWSSRERDDCRCDWKEKGQPLQSLSGSLTLKGTVDKGRGLACATSLSKLRSAFFIASKNLRYFTESLDLAAEWYTREMMQTGAVVMGRGEARDSRLKAARVRLEVTVLRTDYDSIHVRKTLHFIGRLEWKVKYVVKMGQERPHWPSGTMGNICVGVLWLSVANYALQML